MKTILTLFILSFFTGGIYGQEFEETMKFVGYQDKSPVFALESNLDAAEEMVEEAEEAAYDEVVAEAAAGTSVQLFKLNEKTGETETFYAPEGIIDVLCYANGNFVGISQYGSIEVFDNGNYLDFRFHEDFSEDNDFKDRVYDFNERSRMNIVSFSPDGKQLYFPFYNGLKIRIYNFEKQSFSEIDLSKIDDYGGFLLKPGETKNYLFFLASLKGPNELFQMVKTSEEVKKAPFYFGRRGAYGLKYHPIKDEVIFINDEMTFAYSFGTDTFKQFAIPQHAEAKGDELQAEFNKIYYSYEEKEWRYATNDDNQLISKSIGLSGEENYTLKWADVQGLSEKRKLKNQTPIEELNGMLKRLSKIPKPLTMAFKEEINKAIVEFEKKYESSSTVPEVEQALIGANIVRLDTAYFTDEAVKKGKNALIRLVENGTLNYNNLLGMRIIGQLATDQSSVHPARIAVLEALVTDYIEENTFDTYQKLMSSGLNLLVLAHTANNNYDKAISYAQMMVKLMEKYGLDANQKPTYDQLKLQIEELESKKK